MLRRLTCLLLVWLAAPIALSEETEVEAMFNAVVAPTAVEDSTPFVELPITKALGLDKSGVCEQMRIIVAKGWHGFQIAN